MGGCRSASLPVPALMSPLGLSPSSEENSGRGLSSRSTPPGLLRPAMKLGTGFMLVCVEKESKNRVEAQ